MEIIELTLKPASKTERARIFEELYERAFPYAAKFVRKMGGTLDDAKDIFQDALVIFHEKHTQEDFHINSSPEAYLLGISKHLWVRKFKKDRNKVSFAEWEHEIAIPEDYFADYNSNMLLNFLEKAGKKCMELLRAFYYEKSSMSEIAINHGYKNERSATVQKYKCLEKVRDSIKQNSIDYEDFIK